MILCMPERVSGGDAKFQGFCDRWYKWEGQAKNFEATIASARAFLYAASVMLLVRRLARAA